MKSLEFALATTKNRPSTKDRNEDAILVNGCVYSDESSLQAIIKPDNRFHIAISDGLHGTALNEFHAAKSLLHLLHSDILSYPDSHPGQRVTRIHEEFTSLSISLPKCIGMAATLVGAEINADQISIYHVGDSRAWLVSPTGSRLLTTDHTIANSINFNVDECSIGSKNLSSIFNALAEYFVVDSYSARPMNSYLKTLINQEEALILSSDGIAVLGKELPSFTRSNTLTDYIDSLVDTAVQCGSDDNISVVGVRLHP